MITLWQEDGKDEGEIEKRQIFQADFVGFVFCDFQFQDLFKLADVRRYDGYEFCDFIHFFFFLCFFSSNQMFIGPKDLSLY